MQILRERIGLVALVLAAILLSAGIWGPGLWDPWEMNRAFVARRMAEAPSVLVAESRKPVEPASLTGAIRAADSSADMLSTPKNRWRCGVWKPTISSTVDQSSPSGWGASIRTVMIVGGPPGVGV